MRKNLSGEQKLHLITRILSGEKVTTISREANISRTILYRWLDSYKKTHPKKQLNALAYKKSTGRSEWGRIAEKQKRTIIALAKKLPDASLQQLADTTRVSTAAVWKILKSAELNTTKKRKIARQQRQEPKTPEILSSEKLLILKRFESGESVSALCLEFHISRTIFYRWLKRYRLSGEQEVITKEHPKGERHYRYMSGSRELILAIITQQPEISPLQISQLLIQKTGKHVLSKDGVYRILKELDLNTAEKRFAYIQAQGATTFAPQQQEEQWRLPAFLENLPYVSSIPPPSRWFADGHVRFFLILFASSFVFSFLSLSAVQTIVTASSFAQGIGMTFALLSLVMGMFFFLYSFKYYVTLAMLLSFSRTAPNRETNRHSFIEKLFSTEQQKTQQATGMVLRSGMHEDVSDIVLDRSPFVSIHVSTYNEKRVIDRLLTAVTSMNYQNYEVIVADDSDDETKDLIQKWVNHPRIKISHRENRDGYKGQALAQALTLVDPKTEFIAIFDADFIPYPDTIVQFLKYMKATVGTLHPKAIKESPIAAVQGYQWHVLNKSENWITRGVRSEYAGSYVIERSGAELYNGLKQISGSVYMIRKDVLDKVGWGRSITEDFELTLRLYEQGYKVVYTPYIQAPAEAASTIRRLIRQRMRWAEGHSYNMKLMFTRLLFGRWEEKAESSSGIGGIIPQHVLTSSQEKVWRPSPLTFAEKFELVYLAPYYLQAGFFIVGTLAWFISETVFQTRLPFWTEVLGWSLVLTNLFALPLMNMIGLFLENAEEKDYVGIFSFVVLSYVVAPFQAYAAIRGFLEKEEGPWFRTPKTGRITDTFAPNRFYRFVRGVFGKPATPVQQHFAFSPSPQAFQNFHLPKRRKSWVGNVALAIILSFTTLLTNLAPYIPVSRSVLAAESTVKTVADLSQESLPQNPATGDVQKSVDKETLIKNATVKEITTPRAIRKITKGGKPVEFIFQRDPAIKIKLAHEEIEIKTNLFGGKTVNAKRATIRSDKEVIYEEIFPDVDLKYSLTNDLLTEEFIVKSPKAIQAMKTTTITQTLITTNVKVVSPEPSVFGLYSKEGKELFTFSSAFAKDDHNEVTNDVSLAVTKAVVGHTITKTIGASAKQWLTDPARAYPVSIDPSIVVTGGIVETDTQYGGLQRKVAFVNGNWYAIANDAGVVTYKKSADGVNWGAPVTLSNGDTDNFNPDVSVSGNIIHVFWIEDGANGTDTADSIQGLRIDTSNSDALGAVCTTADQGTFSSVFMTSVAAVSATEVVVSATSNANSGSFNLFDITTLDGTCVPGTDLTPGNGTAGSGITAGDRPVMVAMNSDRVGVVFQDGDLSYSEFDVSADDWTTNNMTISAVTDNIYSVVTDGTTLWVLSVSGTTATNFYSCCASDIAETQLDADAGGNGQDNVSQIKMFCPAADNCKIVYTDDIDTAAPTLKFVDCNNESCSSPTVTTVDSDIGAAGDQAGASIYCVAADNCKVAYGDDMDTALPLMKVVDCTADEDCSANTVATVDADLGSNTSIVNTSMYCLGDTDCKVVYNDSGLGDLFFVTCTSENCSTNGGIATLNANTGVNAKNDISCVATDNCKVVYHDSVASDFTFVDCSTAACTNTQVDVDATVGATTGAVSVAIDCVGGDTDCKLLYGDQAAGDMFFVDCGALDCGTTGRTITSIDIAGGANATTSPSVSLDCASVTTCQFTYVGDLTSGGEELYFVDCNGSATCAAASYKVQQLSGPRFRSALQCLTSTNCKMVYYEGTTGTAPTVQFADCDGASCFPTASTLTTPFASGTGITYSSVSLTLDTTNNRLYAHALKVPNGGSEQAYFRDTDKSTISWDTETSYGFTAGDLGHISAPQTAAGETQIGVVVRQGANFEFATVPEYTLLLFLFVALLPKIMRNLRTKRLIYCYNRRE